MKWISRSITAVLYITLCLMLVSVFAMNINGNLFGYQLKTVLSGSMEPTIKVGSIIVVKQVQDQDVNDFHKNDIITFITEEEKVVTHRIHEVKQNGKQYITKGDNNNTPDVDMLLADNILAQYTGITIPYAGYVTNYFNNELLLIILGFLFLGYAAFTFWKIFRELDDRKKGKQSAERK